MAPHVEDGYVPTTLAHDSKTAINSHAGNDFKANVEEIFGQANSREPLELRGVLDQFESFDVTPVIGREFKDVDVVSWLRSPNSDELIRDLAVTSRLTPMFFNISHYHANPTSQYPNEASFSFELKTT